jgi:hypothetical protein
VLDYCLSGFEVTVTAPKKVFVESGRVKGRVTANQTFGEPVQGHVDLKVVLKNMPYDDDSQFWPETQPLNELVLCNMPLQNGAFAFDCDLIESMKLKALLSKEAYANQSFEFEINADVHDEKSGKTCSSQCEFSLMSSRKQVQMISGDDRHFHPGLKYHVRVRVQDANDQPISYESDHDLLWLGWRFSTQTTFTEVPLKPIDGLVAHVLDTPEDESQIMFRAKFRNEKFILGYVHRKYSPSNYRIQLCLQTPLENNVICTDKLPIDGIRLELNATRPLTDFQVFVFDLLLGTFVQVKQVRLQTAVKSTTIHLKPTESWGDKMSIFVLNIYEEGDFKRMAFDKITIKLTNTCSSDLSLELPVERVQPGT